MSETNEERFQISPQQEQLWLAAPDGPAGRVQATISLTGEIDPDAVRASLEHAVARHEILRTTFVHQPGIRVPLQVVRDELAPAWETTTSDDVDGICRQELDAPLDFGAGPLLRGVLLDRGAGHHTLVLTISSLCADVASAGLLIRELAHDLTGQGAVVEEPLQYADFAAWQHELQESEDPEAAGAREFWKAADGAAGPALPFAMIDAPAPIAGEHVAVALGDGLVTAIDAQAGAYGATQEAFFLATWCAVLARSAAADEMTVAFVGSERRHADLDGTIGAVSRTVPLHVAVPASITFAEVLERLVRARADAPVWQDYAPADPATALSTGFVSVDGVSLEAGEASLELELERVLDTGRGLALALTCTTGEGAPRLELCFDPRAHDLEAVKRLARRLERVLEAVAAEANLRVADIDLLGEDERRQLLVEFNDTSGPVPGAGVHELFAHHAAQSPERIAAIDEHGSLTYGALDAQANQLAHRLRGAGVGPGAAVGLCTDRSNAMLVGLLGILKAGGAYVPLHYEHPRARLRQQLETADARAIVTQEPLLARLADLEGTTICLDRDRDALDREPTTAPESPSDPDALAYVIYTSGSTGTPKGVAVTHANVVNYATFIAARLGADAEPLSFGVVTSISTDLGNTSVFGALCSGGTVVLISPVVAADSGAMAAQLETSPVDVLKITPSHLGALLAGGEARVLPRHWLVIGGERAPWDLVERVRGLSEVRILNHYGPTEATIGCCTFEVQDGPGKYAPASVPIGVPIANDRAYLLDDRRAPVPLGAPGQLFVAGAGVARGYVGQAELTSERFVEDPFSGEPAATMYDTGDLARWLPDGTLEFLGRIDEQVKIRGYRVELGEIESVLRGHPQVQEAVVVARPGSAGDFTLTAYCQAPGDTAALRAVGSSAGAEHPDQADLRTYLLDWLPEYMLPSAIAVLDALPRTPSGKIDRQALPDPDTLAEPAHEYVAPSTPLEEAVASIWAGVLGVERVGVEDDFFEIGGHSLLATQVVAQVRSEFAIDLPLHSLFAYPTVTLLTAEIVRMMGDSEGDETAKLVAELEGLSDEEAERLLADEALPEPRQR